jgi:alkylhydroperoxidase/carboxymuconolactone decarboxylase family protein YurZ
MMTWSDEQIRIREDFLRIRGTWGPAWEGILELDPAFLEAYLNFSAVPWRKNHLDAKTKEFIYIAVDAAATHLYEPGIRQHVRAAFSSVPFQTGTLDRKTKTLVYIAFDSAATHLYSPGTRMHMRNALNAGATREEILEVLEIVSVIGIHAATVAVPILLEEVRIRTDEIESTRRESGE